VLLEIDGEPVPWGELPRASPLGEAIVGMRAEADPVVTLIADACRLGKQCIPELQTARLDARGKPVVAGRHLILRANRSILLTSRDQDTSMVIDAVPEAGLAGTLAPEPLPGDLWGNPQSLDNLEATWPRTTGICARVQLRMHAARSCGHGHALPLAVDLRNFGPGSQATDINMALTYASSWPQDGRVAPLDVIKRDDVDFGFLHRHSALRLRGPCRRPRKGTSEGFQGRENTGARAALQPGRHLVQ
jgi:hypothetical protein